MAGHLDDLRRQAVLLSGNSVGVTTETTPRRIQHRNNGTYYSTVDRRWLEQLNLAEQGEKTLHSLSLGRRPVIVQKPAIIIQPADLIQEVDGHDA